MSVAEVTSRIADIQARINQLMTPPTSAMNVATNAAGSATSVNATSASAAFEAQMARALSGVDGAAGSTSGEGSSELTDAVVAEAKKYLGLPYVWGGTDPQRGLDCSGLVQVVYKSLGYDLPRVSNQQATAGRPVASMAQAQPGDLIAWDNSSRNVGVDHIAIYIGDGKMIEAPRTGLDIRIIDVPSTPDVIRRILPDAPASAGAGAVSSAAGLSVAGLTSLSSAMQSSTGLAPSSFDHLFTAAGARHGVSPALLSAVAQQESSYNPQAVSPAGAQGLMQLMPATARGLGVENPFNPAQAVDGAARLLSDLQSRFGSTELALAAYNAGPGAVLRHDGIPPYAETQNYVRRITATLAGTGAL